MSIELVPFARLVRSMRNGLSPASNGTHPGKVLTLSAVTQGRFDATYTKDAAFDHGPHEDQIVRAGMFLVCRGNGNIALVGSGVVVPKDVGANLIFPDTVIGADVDPDQVDSAYLAHVWRTRQTRAQIEAGARTTNGTFKVNQQVLEAISIPLPPLREQRRISAILDRADAIRRKRQEAIALTEQLLRSTFLEMFGDPVSNPKRWPIESLGELATFTGGGTPSRSVPEYFDGATCWATSKDMKGEVLSDTEEHITDDAIQNSATKLVPPGTILVVVKSKILMHRLPVLVSAVPTCFGQDLKGLSLRDPGLTYYIARHMRIGQDTLLRRARGVNTEGLTLEHLAEYIVMQPPRKMVDRYVKFELATTKAAVVSREAHADANHLFNSLVQRAFSGQL